MSIFIDKSTRLLVQGITGRDGSFHTKQMIEYGPQVVGGVTPGKGGQKFESKVPIFNTVADAVKETGANTTVIYVPPMFAADAMMEAADAGIPFIVCITEGVPVLDMTRVVSVREGEGRAPARTELPRPDFSRAVEGRNHSGSNLHAGPGRPRESLRNAHVRSRLPDDAREDRSDDVRGNRRRSDQRHELHRLSRCVREGSGRRRRW